MCKSNLIDLVCIKAYLYKNAFIVDKNLDCIR